MTDEEFLSHLNSLVELALRAKKSEEKKQELFSSCQKLCAENFEKSKRIEKLEKALKAPGYPNCFSVHNDGEGYPPNVRCEKWGIWIDDSYPGICEFCKGKLTEEEIRKHQ